MVSMSSDFSILSDNDDLPMGWEWTTLKEIAKIKGGKRLPKGSDYSDIQTPYPYIRVTDFKDGSVDLNNIRYISEEIQRTISNYTVNENDLYISIAGSIGIVGLIPKELHGANLTENAAKILLNQNINPKYLYQILSSKELRIQIYDETISTTQPKLALFRIETLKIPLPPLNEQKRIVEKVEALMARSRKAKEALDAIPKLIEQFRQSVLAAAFRGDLTADWREQNNAQEWYSAKLGDVIKEKPRNGYSPKPVDYPTSTKSLTLSATTSGKFKPEYSKYIDEVIPESSYLWLYPDDILIQRSNTIGYVGTCAIYDCEPREFIYPDTMMKIQVVKEKVTTQFLYYQLSDETVRSYFRNNATGTAGNMPKINQQIVMNTPLIIPSLKEQEEIVSQIQSSFKVIDKLKALYYSCFEDFSNLNQSILSKAFKGELVEQDPNDEPASVLLERIQKEREKEKAKVKQTGAKKLKK